jgi:toxin ParE1/3/4
MFHLEAEQELAEAIAYYDSQRAGLGTRFRDAVEEAVLQLVRTPKAFSPYDRHGTRKYVMRKFPYNLYFLELADVLWIVAVAHQRRRPNYWRHRLRR